MLMIPTKSVTSCTIDRPAHLPCNDTSTCITLPQSPLRLKANRLSIELQPNQQRAKFHVCFRISYSETMFVLN